MESTKLSVRASSGPFRILFSWAMPLWAPFSLKIFFLGISSINLSQTVERVLIFIHPQFSLSLTFTTWNWGTELGSRQPKSFCPYVGFYKMNFFQGLNVYVCWIWFVGKCQHPLSVQLQEKFSMVVWFWHHHFNYSGPGQQILVINISLVFLGRNGLLRNLWGVYPEGVGMDQAARVGVVANHPTNEPSNQDHPWGCLSLLSDSREWIKYSL